MKCDEVQSLLFEYLTGDLSEEQALSVRDHLATGCAACAGAFAEIEAISARMLAEIDQVDPSGGVEERLAARLEDVTAPLPARFDFPGTFVTIAATALIAVCGTWILRSSFEAERRGEIARMQAEIGKRKDELGALKRAFEASEDFAIALRSADARMVSFVVSDPKFNTAAGRAIWDAETGRVCLSVRGLPTAVGTNRHRVWLDDGRTVSQLTEFKVTPTGEAAIVVKLPDGAVTPSPRTRLLVSLDAVSDEAPGGPDQVILVGMPGSAVQIASRSRLPAGTPRQIH